MNLGPICTFVSISPPAQILYWLCRIQLLTFCYAEEYIANYNGHLLSSLERTPTIPSDSSLPVPSNVVLSLRSYANGAACSNSSGGILNFAGPETCWDLTVAVDPIVWTGFQPTSNEGWSISVYNISTCTGTPLVTFDQNSVNECITVGKNGGAYLSLTPLWNYD